MIVRPFGNDDRERFGGLPVFMCASFSRDISR
jgi:hypothetical protein